MPFAQPSTTSTSTNPPFPPTPPRQLTVGGNDGSNVTPEVMPNGEQESAGTTPHNNSPRLDEPEHQQQHAIVWELEQHAQQQVLLLQQEAEWAAYERMRESEMKSEMAEMSEMRNEMAEMSQLRSEMAEMSDTDRKVIEDQLMRWENENEGRRMRQVPGDEDENVFGMAPAPGWGHEDPTDRAVVNFASAAQFSHQQQQEQIAKQQQSSSGDGTFRPLNSPHWVPKASFMFPGLGASALGVGSSSGLAQSCLLYTSPSPRD